MWQGNQQNIYSRKDRLRSFAPWPSQTLTFLLFFSSFWTIKVLPLPPLPPHHQEEVVRILFQPFWFDGKQNEIEIPIHSFKTHHSNTPKKTYQCVPCGTNFIHRVWDSYLKIFISMIQLPQNWHLKSPLPQVDPINNCNDTNEIKRNQGWREKFKMLTL